MKIIYVKLHVILILLQERQTASRLLIEKIDDEQSD